MVERIENEVKQNTTEHFSEVKQFAAYLPCHVHTV